MQSIASLKRTPIKGHKRLGASDQDIKQTSALPNN